MPETSSAPRAQQADPTGTALTHLSLRELLQRLATCEELLRVPGPDGDRLSSAVPPAWDRQAVLREQAAISGELERRRHLRHPRQRGVERRRSAAWPPPPW